MNDRAKPLILHIDDDPDMRRLIERLLTNRGFRVMMADSGKSAFAALDDVRPDLILLDVTMPEMDGYEVCSRMQENKEFSHIPVVFVTGLGEEQDKARAFAAGGVDYIVKPFKKDLLLQKLRVHLQTSDRWKRLQEDAAPWNERILPSDFLQFKESLFNQLDVKDEVRDKFCNVPPSKIYSICKDLGIGSGQMAQYMAKFLQLPYLPHVFPEDVELGMLPSSFCQSNLVVPVRDTSGKSAYVLSNPLNWELLDILKKFSALEEGSELNITEPENIAALFQDGADEIKMDRSVIPTVTELEESERDERSVLGVFNDLINTAVSERASDIHIEPKENNMSVRYRIDGEMKEGVALDKKTGLTLISRFKALGSMDIAERRRPQDGGLQVLVENRSFQLRLASSFTAYGESLTIRVLELRAKIKMLQELGMADEQVDTMIDFVNQATGLILVTGPTGSGKTTTIFSLLSQADCKSKSLISVEDPVEYRIPFAKQHQVNEKAGITFESLVRSVVRQDPDILFLGEIRDQYSANIAMEFASTGHLTVTTLHSSNATTAIVRLERLAVDRGIMADALACIIAQRLLKKLCPYCKQTVDISPEEIERLAPFTNEVPSEVGRPVGCARCNNTGYCGREGVYEILIFDAEIVAMIRSGTPISEIRGFTRTRGDYLISHHAVEKVRKLLVSPKEAYEKVLVEDIMLKQEKSKYISPKATVPQQKKDQAGSLQENKAASILVVDDDKDIRLLIKRLLEERGYDVTLAEDGVDALLYLGRTEFDLIISDILMPNLDGFKLLEMITQKGINGPVMFLTASSGEESEVIGFELGAADYLRKPIKKEVLLLRVARVLESTGAS